MKKLLLLITLFTLNTHHTISQWVQQPLPVYKPITCIKFVNSQTGWACTDYGSQQDTGYIIATTNSGTNWFVQLAVFGNTFTDLNAIDSITCFASAFDININRDKLYKTTNGGANWTTLTMVPNMGIDDMQFLNKDSAWECGASVGPDVRTTTDGGNTWIVRTSGLSQPSNKIYFLNYNTGYCCSDFLLHKTTNAGLNWNVIGSFGQLIKSIFFLDNNTGWIGFHNNNRIRFTSNNGLNWIDQVTPPVIGTAIYDLYFFNNNTGYAGYGIDKIFKTTNGGINWGYQLDTGGALHISFIDTNNGWTSTFNGITHTSNGGGQIVYTGFVNNGSIIPKEFKLYQNYPNPFNPITTIKLELPVSTNIKLVICDILGSELYHITDQYLKAGSYTFTWDASKYSSGIYFYRLITDKYTEIKKMILLK